MEVQMVLVFFGFFALLSLILSYVYQYTIKEKSYEEALAEQRQHKEALFGKNKTKAIKSTKKKELKKQNKTKENQPQEQSPIREEEEEPQKVDEKEGLPEEEVEENSQVQVKKVEFKENVEDKTHKRGKKEKQITLNKEDAIQIDIKKLDEVELPIEAVEKPQVEPSKTEKILIQSEKSSSSSSKESVKEKVKEVSEALAVRESLVISTSESNKNKGKKKKSDKLTIDQNACPDLYQIQNLVCKAELSRNDLQILIDLLLNKQHDENPQISNEWSENKPDPLAKLKKQLAEREVQLADEWRTLTSIQSKLQEVRAEQKAERALYSQKLREFETTLQGKDSELTQYQKQVQLLKQQLQDEAGHRHKVQEENLSVQLKHEQLEYTISQLQSENGILQNDNQKLHLELNRLNTENCGWKENEQIILKQLESFRAELDQKVNHIRTLEELHVESENNLEAARRQENDFQIEISRLTSICNQESEEIRRLEHSQKQIQDDVFHFQKLKEESDKIILHYKLELQKVNEEKTHLHNLHINGTIESSKAQDIELKNLHNEISSLQTQLKESEIEYSKEIQAKNELKTQLEASLKEQQEKNDTLRIRNHKLNEELKTVESRVETTRKDLSVKFEESQKELIRRLFPNIEELAHIPPKEFGEKSEMVINEYLNRENAENNSLKDIQIQTLKSAFDNSEKVLHSLQSQIESVELSWKNALEEKNQELGELKKKLEKNNEL